jgi:hypothetical protein
VWQLPSLSISPLRRLNRKPAIPAVLGQATMAEILRKKEFLKSGDGVGKEMIKSAMT